MGSFFSLTLIILSWASLLSTEAEAEAEGIRSARLLDLLIRDNVVKSFDKHLRTGYQLVSPVLGLLAYNAGTDVSSGTPFEVGILARENNPIKINFSNVITNTTSSRRGIRPLCASFGGDGKVRLKNQVSPNVCVATRHGHFGLLIELPPSMPVRKRIRTWKLAVGSSIGAALGAFLLGLLLVSMLVKVKKKARMEELERRAYEEEALQVSMVGHFRAPTASVTRTTPTIEHEYSPYPS
ncbi:uncharacterized protein LOC108480658 isoform X2 [Gossypium arboreum]|uniref:uncharacterized protein LOC108480658 isoform X2 n=1 Tax=Gossypium arboreum TaxID=29729 RepID=UPI000818F2F6|nr:uncharacterized protein LOC108480658 isoform X2 [Gossypium arboreum]